MHQYLLSMHLHQLVKTLLKTKQHSGHSSDSDYAMRSVIAAGVAFGPKCPISSAAVTYTAIPFPMQPQIAAAIQIALRMNIVQGSVYHRPRRQILIRLLMHLRPPCRLLALPLSNASLYDW